MPNEHRLKAIDALNLIPSRDNPADEMSCASEATAYALLAVEARLGELVEQQRITNAIAAYGCIGAYGDAEYMQARDTVRGLLGLSVSSTTDKKAKTVD